MLIRDNGGYGLWVSEAYGEFWGFMESYWSWVSIVVDSALYPVLAFKVATLPFVSSDTEIAWPIAYIIKLSFVMIWTAPNLLGLQLVGNGLVVLGLFVLIPFILLSIWCLFYFNFDNVLVIQAGQPPVIEGNPWLNLITNLFWNYSGFDCISTFAGEIHEPKKTLPRALLGSLVLVVLSYFFPLVFAAGAAKPPASEWAEAGYWSIIAQNVGGTWLCVLIIIASFLGNMGLFIAKMFENSWQIQGMADAGVIPRVFSYLHPRFGSPWLATALSFSIIAVLISFDFDFIITIDTTFNCAAAILEMCAFYSLRFSKPTLIRPFKVPFSSHLALIAFLSIPVATGCFVLFNGFFQSFNTAVVNTSATLLGFLLYFCLSKFGYIKYNYKHIDSDLDSENEGSVGSCSDDEGNPSKDGSRRRYSRSSSLGVQKEYQRMNSRDEKGFLFPRLLKDERETHHVEGSLPATILEVPNAE